MSKSKEQNEFNRREFLKTSLVASVAASAMGVAAAGENAPDAPSATTGSKTERPSLIRVSSAKPGAPLRKPWKNTIGTGYPPVLLRADLQGQLAKLQRNIGFRCFRCHGLFHDDMAVVARRKDGSLAFKWDNVDKVFDVLLRLGLRPRVELTSMPVALASGTTTVADWGWNTTPPRNYAEWGQLVGAFARHCLDRYGLDEIAQWYYDVWNEPNINYWTGTQEDYWKLYDVSAKALKAVNPRLRVGGPVTARCAWVAEMISHCSAKGVPLDYINTHIYPQDEWILCPNLQGSPYQPGRFLPDMVREVGRKVRRSAMRDLEVHITEWSTIVPLPDGKLSWDENPNAADNLAAAATACDLAVAVDGDCEDFCWWEASDLWPEGGMPQREFSGSCGLVTLSGLPKATFNAFSFLNRLRGGRLEVRHEALPPGCGLVATTEGESLQVLMWYRNLSVYGVGAPQPWTGVLELPWTDSPRGVSGQIPAQDRAETTPRGEAKPVLLQERITAGAGSCYETWQSLGTPQNLSPTERDLLEVHSTPEARLFKPQTQGGRVTHDFRLASGEVLYCELRPQGAVALPKAPLRQELAAWYAARREKSK